MPRYILIVHESYLIRKIVSGFALSELNDAIVDTASSPKKGLKLLGEKKYDVVLSAVEMADMDGVEFRRRIRALELNRYTPFIVTTSTNTPEQLDRLRRQGAEHILITPFTSRELGQKIDEACDLRQRRSNDRFSIPGTEAIIYFEGFNFHAEVINISRQGLWCELVYQDDYSRPLRPFKLDLVFPADYGLPKAENILAAILRLTVMSYRAEHIPDLVRVGYQFVEMSPQAAATLEAALQKAERDNQLDHEVLKKSD